MLQAAEPTMNGQKASPGTISPRFAPGFAPAMEQATLGATMVVKGELSGAQPLYVDGRVEGSIHFPGHRVTIGRSAMVLADIEAKEAVLMGTVTGNIVCTERVDIRADAVLTGDVVTQRISIDEGALVKGSVEIRKMEPGVVVNSKSGAKAETAARDSASPGATELKSEAPARPAVPVPAAVSAEALKAAAAAASSPSQGPSLVPGSKVLWVEHKEKH